MLRTTQPRQAVNRSPLDEMLTAPSRPCALPFMQMCIAAARKRCLSYLHRLRSRAVRCFAPSLVR